MAQNDPWSKDSQLNARLRGEYHKIAENTGKCVFCDLRDKYIIKEKNGMVLTVNLFPYIDGQLMIIPRRHIERYSELTEKEILTNFILSKQAINVLRKRMGVEGLWLVLREGALGETSGKTVKHLHWNIMPYNDRLNTWHYQEITVPPIELAARLRPEFK
jgi:ATP adenylyltransferase